MYQPLISEIFSFTEFFFFFDLPMIERCMSPYLIENEYEIPINLLIIPIFNIKFTITGNDYKTSIFFKALYLTNSLDDSFMVLLYC